jgi:hypothetical protein
MLNLAALAVTGSLLASAGFAQDPQTDRPQDRDRVQQTDRQQGTQARAGLPDGIKWSDKEVDLDDVRGVIDGIAGAAIAEGGFDDVVERLVDQDRNRFGEWIDQGENNKFTQLNESTKRFRDAYKAKYNKDFDFNDQALAGLTAVEGEVEDPSLVAQKWPVAATPGLDRPQDGRVAGGEDVTDSQGNIEKGRQVAIATLPAPKMGAADKAGSPHDRPGAAADRDQGDAAQDDRDARVAGAGVQPASGMGGGLRVSLVNEFPGSWKIDVPNQRSPQQVYSDLSRRLGQLADANMHWPSDEAQLHHMVAYDVLCAIYGVESPGRQPLNGTPRPAAGGDPMDDR